MKDKIIMIVIFIALVVFALLINKWYFGAIVGSDMPDWLKYILLKG